MPANHRPWLLQGSLALATLAIAVASLCFGQFPLSLSAVGHTLIHLPPGEGVIGQIVWSVRLPRVVIALLAGGALGLCGATLQGVFQNPLVDPHIIGVTSGSAFGGTLAILLGVGGLLMMASTFFFGLVALGLIYALAALQGRDSTLGLILSGIILSGFFAALVSLMQYLADSEETLPNIVFWLLGSFATASWHKVLLMILPMAVAAGVLWKLRWRINLLALEERDALVLAFRWPRCVAPCWSAARCWWQRKWRSAAASPGWDWWSRTSPVCWWAPTIVACCPPPSGSAPP